MPEPLAIIGAITGTTSLAVTLWRERRGVKRSLKVERGWQYACNSDGELIDIWVYVMAYNTGRRPLHIEHAGWEVLTEGPREMADAAGIGPDNKLWLQTRFEIALNGETLEAIPDGPSVKIWTRLVPICAYGIDPGQTLVRPYVVTVPETYWRGEPGPLLARRPPGRTEDEAIADIERLVNDEIAGNFKSVLDTSGVIGLPRLIVDGDVERATDILRGRGLPDDWIEGAGP